MSDIRVIMLTLGNGFNSLKKRCGKGEENMKITFFGAVEEVTGSRYLVEQSNTKILVDCGMFQGPWEIAKRNWDPFPVDPKSIEAIVLTHAHIDHTGYIPAFVKRGFKGPIYCSPGTYALCKLMLVDSGHLQEESAKRAHDEADHEVFDALYTVRDAEESLKFFKPVEYDTAIKIGALTVTLIRSGHILGSAFVVVSDGTKKLTFSGDLGRPEQFIMKTPPPVAQTDFLVLESTYGDRLHAHSNTLETLGETVRATVAKGGLLVIPCFAVGRTEEILYCLYQLQQQHKIPTIPIYLDSPMAIKVAEFFCDYKDEYTFPQASCKDIFSIAKYVRTKEESKQLNDITHPAIIIAGSGMADGGRVPYHLKHCIADPKNTVLFVGFQARGTNGHALVHGVKKMKIQGKLYSVRADVREIKTMSAHADADEIVTWLSHFEQAPKTVFVTHGELKAAEALKATIEKRFQWSVVIPKYAESFELS